MDDPCRELVRRYEHALATPLPDAPACPLPTPPPPAPGAPVALLFSPHPDDEALTGALPLRLQREAGARVVNVAVTLGSNPVRREERRRELAAACALLGWELEIPGWAGVTSAAAHANDAAWQAMVHAAAEIIRRHRPRWVFYPHADDAHPAHQGTYLLATQALDEAALAADHAPPSWRVLTEYWQPHPAPNLLVECPPEQLAALLAALCRHRGELARHPYHRTLPAWMLDNVRRGAERLGGPGAGAAPFAFGTLYRVEPALPPGWPALLPAGEKMGW